MTKYLYLSLRTSIWCFVQTWFPWLGFVLTASVFFAAASFSCAGKAMSRFESCHFVAFRARPDSCRSRKSHPCGFAR
jgi:uncharacterized membrane protein YjjB (DUF3815 family)